MTDYREADLSRVRTVPIAQRPNKVDPSLLARLPGTDRRFAAFWAALVAWLASDECSFSTGAVYDFSGGRATY